jgi:hypothetical protein
LKVLRSGHYLAKFLSLPDWETYPDNFTNTLADEQEPAKEKVNSKPVPKPPLKPVWKICKCGRRFKMKTTRQKKCNNCLSNAEVKND